MMIALMAFRWILHCEILAIKRSKLLLLAEQSKAKVLSNANSKYSGFPSGWWRALARWTKPQWDDGNSRHLSLYSPEGVLQFCLSLVTKECSLLRYHYLDELCFATTVQRSGDVWTRGKTFTQDGKQYRRYKFKLNNNAEQAAVKKTSAEKLSLGVRRSRCPVETDVDDSKAKNTCVQLHEDLEADAKKKSE